MYFVSYFHCNLIERSKSMLSKHIFIQKIIIRNAD